MSAVLDNTTKTEIDPEVLLSVQNLTKYFPITGGLFSRTVGHVKAVDGVSFDVKRGETLGLVGESGCGKTTTGRAVLRLIEPTSGNVYFEGKDIVKASKSELRNLRREMQIVFQDPFGSLNPRMSVGEIIEDTGFKELIGSWKIIAMSLPRILRICSGVFLRRSSP